ncbi:MAG: DUF2950 family protein [Polyangiaceae bacterium]|nr:DUF2950 family protein [Polyangiaceae bacterium]
MVEAHEAAVVVAERTKTEAKMNIDMQKISSAPRTTLAVAAALAAAVSTGCASSSKTVFNRPEQATDALVSALASQDEDELRKLLGPDADKLLSSGDPAADRSSARAFIRAYKQRHQLKYISPDAVRLVVGDDAWAMPIPLVRDATGWTFSVEEGKSEIAARFVGEGELSAIEVCLAIVDAQREYAYRDPDGNGIADYAEKVISDPGKKNGLYWETAAGEEPSPLDRSFADAIEGRSPVHGYRYRMLGAQGPNANGGERDYRIRGKLIAGFGVVAWPRTLDETGQATFMVNQDGVVYQTYLGARTAHAAMTLPAFDPGPGWTQVSAVDIAAATGTDALEEAASVAESK